MSRRNGLEQERPVAQASRLRVPYDAACAAETPDGEDVARRADLTSEVCPMTFVRAKIHLEQIETGDLIEFILKEGEQMRNVPISLQQEGHRIESVRKDRDRYHLRVRKGG